MSHLFSVAGTAGGHMLHIEHAGFVCETSGIVSIPKPPEKMLPGMLVSPPLPCSGFDKPGKVLTMIHVVVLGVEVLPDHG